MKNIGIAVLLLFITSCSLFESPINRFYRIYNNTPFIEGLEITVSLNDSVSITKIENISFNIKNLNNTSYYINTYSLTFFLMVYDEKGNRIGRYSTRHSMTDPDVPQYVLIDGNSEKTLILKTDFFNNQKLGVEKSYIYEIEYYNSISKKPSQYPTFIGRVDIDPIIFKTCE